MTGIRGNICHRFAAIAGETCRAGGAPRDARRDAVLAGAELACRPEQFWRDAETRGHDMVLTIGEFWTDPALHGITKAPGSVRFTLDARSLAEPVLDAVEAECQRLAAEISASRGVRIAPGPHTRAATAPMSSDVVSGLRAAAEATGTPFLDIAPGGGHDCAVFAVAGVLFIRNSHCSHNPDEAMALEDFACVCDVLRAWAAAELGVEGGAAR